jgi:hypothetical protein
MERVFLFTKLPKIEYERVCGSSRYQDPPE